MEENKKAYKIILDCDKYGVVKQIGLDTGSFLENINLPVGLHSLVAPNSIQALGSFWLSIQEKAMIQNVVLSMRYNGQQHDYTFSGYLLKESVMLCGNTDVAYTGIVLDDLMQINNEQTNHIRLSEKKVGNLLKAVESNQMDEAFLNDFTSLNNELINKKRELILTNQKIELLNKELNAANENMRMFTHSVSHDLKEPVRMVNLYLTLFNKKFGESLDPKGKIYIEMAFNGSVRLRNMLTDLLQYHQSSTIIKTETVDLNDVFIEVKEILQNKIELKNAFIKSDKLPTVYGSFAAYRQVFQNLIANAIKFVEEGKTPEVSIHAKEHDANYTLHFKDNGIGIAEDQTQHVFNLFKRLNSAEQYEGTGMGLALVKKNIERMGGEIWLESEEGVGSTFNFTVRKNMEA